MIEMPSEKEQRENTQKLVSECLIKIEEGDPDAGTMLAQIFLGELPCKDVYVPLAVVEALLRQSEALGSSDAKEYLETQWPQLKGIFVKRLGRRGLRT